MRNEYRIVNVAMMSRGIHAQSGYCVASSLSRIARRSASEASSPPSTSAFAGAGAGAGAAAGASAGASPSEGASDGGFVSGVGSTPPVSSTCPGAASAGLKPSFDAGAAAFSAANAFVSFLNLSTAFLRVLYALYESTTASRIVIIMSESSWLKSTPMKTPASSPPCMNTAVL